MRQWKARERGRIRERRELQEVSHQEMKGVVDSPAILALSKFCVLGLAVHFLPFIFKTGNKTHVLWGICEIKDDR